MTTATSAAALRYAGPAARLSAGAVDRAAGTIGVEPAALSALLIVETGLRSGFLPDGRPRILYEAHIAHSLSGRPVPGLSVQNWDRSLYASTGSGEYQRLYRAVEVLGEDVALQAASWGLGQVLGANHSLCGYATVQGMVRAMGEGEDQQLGAVVAFLRARKIVEPLRRKAWPQVARLYNGTAYRENRYDEKLALCYMRTAAGGNDGILGPGDYGPEVGSLQRALQAAGFRITVDGDFGRVTRNALERYQVEQGLAPTGVVDPLTAERLGLADPRATM